jgi:hypothetical protein
VIFSTRVRTAAHPISALAAEIGQENDAWLREHQRRTTAAKGVVTPFAVTLRGISSGVAPALIGRLKVCVLIPSW